jgi:hypothetical protein
MNEYEKQANLFLLNTNTSFQYVLYGVVLGFPNHDDDKAPRNHFKVLLKNAKGSLELDFYGSINDYQQGIETLSPYDVLSSIASSSYGITDSMWEFAENYGYVINNEKTFKNVQRIHKGVKREYEAIKTMFSPKEIEQLVEIA